MSVRAPMEGLIWLVFLVCGGSMPSRGQQCNDPTIAAVKNLYNRDCTPDTVTIRTALPLTLQRGDTYGRNLIVYGREVGCSNCIRACPNCAVNACSHGRGC